LLADAGAAVMTLGVLLLYTGGRLEVWHLYVAEAISGICWAFQGPAYTAAITMLLPSRHYARAAGLRSVATFGADAVAPFLAGVQSALGAGAVAGGVVMGVWGGPRRRIHGVLAGAAISFLTGDLLFAIGRTLPVWLVAAFVGAFFVPIIMASDLAIWQAKV